MYGSGWGDYFLSGVEVIGTLLKWFLVIWMVILVIVAIPFILIVQLPFVTIGWVAERLCGFIPEWEWKWLRR